MEAIFYRFGNLGATAVVTPRFSTNLRRSGEELIQKTAVRPIYRVSG
jgi:hypothetical protein